MTDPGLDVFLRYAELQRARVPDFNRYPFSMPAVRTLERLYFHPEVTYFVGDNGSGKSTLLEAIAIATGFNAEGGSNNLKFATRRSESTLHEYLTVMRGARRPNTGFFLRAESFFNVATELEKGGSIRGYGDVPLHELSHGESFLALVHHRFWPNGLYLLDEPESALSPHRQLALLSLMHDRVRKGSQFIIATHSPIVLSYPHAQIYALDETGARPVTWEETAQVALTRDFVTNRERYLRALFGVSRASR